MNITVRAPSAPQSLLEKSAERTFAAGDLVFDFMARDVRKDGKRLPIKGKQYLVLEYLAICRGSDVCLFALFRHVYGKESSASPEAIYTFVRRLREKLSDAHSAVTLDIRRRKFRLQV